MRYDASLIKTLKRVCRESDTITVKSGPRVLYLRSWELLRLLDGLDGRIRDLEQLVDSRVCCWDEHASAEEARTSARIWKGKYKRLYRDLLRARKGW